MSWHEFLAARRPRCLYRLKILEAPLFDLLELLQGQGTAWHGGKGCGAVKVIAVVARRRWLHWKRILRQGSGLLSAHPRCLLAVIAAMAGMKSQSSRARASWCIQIAQEAQVLDAWMASCIMKALVLDFHQVVIRYVLRAVQQIPGKRGAVSCLLVLPSNLGPSEPGPALPAVLTPTKMAHLGPNPGTRHIQTG